MALFGKVVDFLTGGLGEKIVETATKYFPPKLSEEERAQIDQAIRQASREHELALLTLAQQEQEDFNNRLRDLEGTASDLNQAGRMGRLVLFLRGAQRPLWGYFVLYMDVMVFSKRWDLSSLAGDSKDMANLQSAFWVVNFLVLGFLFGERAVRNVMPLVKGRLGDSAQPEAEAAKG